ncbi:hypothetical protein R3P38DRAFT_3194026 [Favolaschia claudopus]|uniref:F-box protein n=1 Tax=Favolaschia claudopus TaxID=2862362 RepID=A0AAW0BFQ2_9AGAR
MSFAGFKRRRNRKKTNKSSASTHSVMSSVSSSLSSPPPSKHSRSEDLAVQQSVVRHSTFAAMFPALLTLLNCFNVMEAILGFVDFRDMLAFGQSNKAFQEISRRFFRTRVDRQISTFLSSAPLNSSEFSIALQRFWDLMDRSHSAVHGSLLLYLERCEEAVKPWIPANLNIAIPCGALFPWIRYLHSLSAGDMGFRELEVDACLQVHIASRYRFELVPGRHIILTQTQGPSIAEAIVLSPHTANIQFLTKDFLVMYYPRKAFDGSAIDSWYYPPIQASQDLERRGIRKSIDNSSWLTGCGAACPILWRHFSRDRDSLVLRVGSDSAVLDPVIMSSKMKWRLGDTCYNSECKNYATHYYPFMPRIRRRAAFHIM